MRNPFSKVENDDAIKWYKSMPDNVRSLIRQYPPGKYVMRPGAPYGINPGGTTVHVVSYGEDGSVGVLVMAQNKIREALEHEKMLGLKHQKSTEEMIDLHLADVRVTVDPVWLELIEAIGPQFTEDL